MQGSSEGRIEQGAGAAFGRSHTLDVLRGLAIAGVMAIHVSQAFPSGFKTVDFLFGSGWVGVNVFYFVSAMTMCLMWTRRATEANPTRKFYIRRSRRSAATPTPCTCRISPRSPVCGLVWPLADGLLSLVADYALTAALSYLASLATWRLVEGPAQELSHRLTTSSDTRASRAETVAASPAAVTGRSAGA